MSWLIEGYGSIRDFFEVNVTCLGARYDPVTEQARWRYLIDLKNKQTEPEPRAGTSFT